MAHTAQQILDRARYKANDETPTTWTDAEALLLINDAQRAIVSRLPKAAATMGQPTLAVSSRQTLSGLSLTRGIEVLDVICNVSGSTRGTPVRKVSRAWLDDEVAAWHTTTASDVEYWAYDERDPTAFWIYPHITGGTRKLEVLYAAPPADLGALSSSFGLDDIYAEAAQWYLLFSMYLKDATKFKSATLANTYYQLFLSSLGIREKSIIDDAVLKDLKERGA